MKKVMYKAMGVLLCAVLTAPGLALPASAARNTSDYAAALYNMVKANTPENTVESIVMQIGNTNMTVNGETQKISNEAGDENLAPTVNDDDRTLLPIRAVTEIMGAEVGWKEENGVETVSISQDNTDIEMQINSDIINVNGESVAMDTAAEKINGRTMVPVRAVLENLGCSVNWNQQSKEITITKPYQTKRLMVKSSGRDLRDSLNYYTSEENILENDGLYIVQFDKNVSDLEVKNYCEEINNLGGVEYAEPDLIAISASNEGAGSDMIDKDRIHLREYIRSKNILGSIKIGVIEANGFGLSPVKNKFVIENDLTDNQGHGANVTGIIEGMLEDIDYCIYAYSASCASLLDQRIDDAVKAGCKVLNLSMYVKADDDIETLKETVDKVKDKCLIVAAAGNDGNLVTMKTGNNDTSYYPAAWSRQCDNIITVANVDEQDRPCKEGNGYDNTTNYGREIDISAPGTEITARGIELTGTSQSTPHVSAAAAVLMLENGNVSPGYIKNKLKTDYVRTPAGFDTYNYGTGILDMFPQRINTETPETVPPSETPVTPSPITPPPITPSPVTPAPQSSIVAYKWGESSIRLNVGESRDIKLYAMYSDGTEADVTDTKRYSSTGQAITISGSTIKAVSAGTAYVNIGAMSASVSAPRAIEVIVVGTPEQIPTLTGYEWSSNSVDIEVGESKSIKLYAVYSDGSKDDVTRDSRLSSRDTGVAVISGTTVTGISPGTTYIQSNTAVSASAKSPKPITVTVKAKEASVSSVSLYPQRLTMKPGDSETLEAEVMPQNAVNKECTFQSSNSSVASVSSKGVVTAKSAGTASITVTTKDGGYTAVCEVTVEKSAVLYGDLNSDGKVNTIDVVLMQDIISGEKKATSQQLTAGDLDGNGYIDDSDLMLLKKRAMGISTPFPVER
ncbi:MAG: stalk domain-containing protein [Clostridiales bacterium]|nr:stalk domain-containing protein [Clostridiales bacterium]